MDRENAANRTHRPRPVLLDLLNILLVAVVAAAGLGIYCIRMPGTSFSGPLAPLDADHAALEARLRAHVDVLAGQIGERNDTRLPQLNEAADYITQQFSAMGYVPAQQEFGAKGYRNIVVDLYGQPRRDQLLVVGAHYDTTGFTRGADDNASGVAALIEIARALHERHLRRSVRFIAFTNEERPFFGTDDMGSRVSARHARDRREDIVGMFSLEMLGFYSDEPRSQFYPRIIRHFYPRQGNFIGFVSNLESRSLLHTAIGSFRLLAALPSEGLCAPEWLVPDIRRSDNASYWDFGFPAVMVTDTSNFRNYNYHNAGDTPATLDYQRMARLVSGLTAMFANLATD